MNKLNLRLIFAGLFTLSLAVAGVAFAAAAVPAPSPLLSCPHCDADGGCAGSTCTCVYNGPTNSYVCKPPTQ